MAKKFGISNELYEQFITAINMPLDLAKEQFNDYGIVTFTLNIINDKVIGITAITVSTKVIYINLLDKVIIELT